MRYEEAKTLVPWKRVSLEDVANINPKCVSVDDDTEVSFIPMAGVSESGKLLSKQIKKYVEVKKGFTPFQDDDVLVAKITPCFENGKGALLSGLRNGIGFGSTEFHVIRAGEFFIARVLIFSYSARFVSLSW